MKYQKAILLVLISISIGACASSPKNKQKMLNTSTVTELDINKYMGVWYEIARYPHSFEKGLVGVTATYKLLDNGKIEVINQGFKNTLDGEFSKAKGKAKRPDPNVPGRFKVSFFLFFYANYLVMELDPDYKWALIGSSTDKYLWILSRTPKLSKKILDDILERAKKRGYDLSRLIMVEQ